MALPPAGQERAMRTRLQFFRPNPEEDEKQARLMRKVIADSLEILRKSPPPDTFLGRKTQEPFPKEKNES
jgi:hypothetical protein